MSTPPSSGQTPSLAQLAAELRADAASKSLQQANERLAAQTNTTSKLRMEFFDRIVLLDGGTISLSLTLVNLFVSKKLDVGLLFASWALFVVSMALAMARNWREHDRLMASEWTTYTLSVNELVEGSEATGRESWDRGAGRAGCAAAG